MNIDAFLGLTDVHVCKGRLPSLTGEPVYGHSDALEALANMRTAAQEDGVDFMVISSFRSYADQKRLWELKVSGQRPILDDNAQPITYFATEDARFWAIARWSAVPGLSRHHWGTDFDIFDARAIQNGWTPQLVCDEFDNEPCAKLDDWLSNNAHKFGFFRPYEKDTTQGVGREPWHISYFPVANRMRLLSVSDGLIRAWSKHPFTGKDWAIAHVDQLIPWFLGEAP